MLVQPVTHMVVQPEVALHPHVSSYYLYISQQIYQGIFLNDQVSQLTHIVGGCVGGIYGLTNRN